MSTNPSPRPDRTDRGKLVGIGVILAIVVVLLVLAAYGLGFWGGGATANP